MFVLATAVALGGTALSTGAYRKWLWRRVASGIDNATKAENCLRDTSGRRAKSLERRIGAEAIRRIITACRSGRMAAGAIGGISENAPTRLSPAYEAEEPSALR
jgi:hypothetical protein